MRAGLLDRKITLQTQTETLNSFREVVKTWTDLVTVRAQVTPMRGNEIYKADRPVSLKTTKFVIRYRTDLDEEVRIKYKNEYYNVVHIAEIGRRVGLELTAELVD